MYVNKGSGQDEDIDIYAGPCAPSKRKSRHAAASVMAVWLGGLLITVRPQRVQAAVSKQGLRLPSNLAEPNQD